MHLMIFSPGKVTHGFAFDDATNEELYDMLYTAATKEQGNGRNKKEEVLDRDTSMVEESVR